MMLYLDVVHTSDLESILCVKTKATREYEGKEYPYYPLDISSASHPFYTGEQRKTSTEGRVASFNKRFGAFGGRSKKAADAAE